MTGFGRSRSVGINYTLTVEIQSVNSKQFDFNLRMPPYFKPAENEVRMLIQKSVERGKVDCNVFCEWSNNERPSGFNKEVIKQYYHDLIAATEGIPLHPDTLLSAVMRLPEVTRQKNIEADSDEIDSLLGSVRIALDNFNAFRINEGAALEQDLVDRINGILNFRMQIFPLANERISQVRNKLSRALEEIVLVKEINQDRYEQEIIYYLEKLDITEEQTRLKTHCDYFLDTISEPSSGRKLGFIVQEIGREINTIGSKANHSGIQKIVVSMKDELEKIKEQIANIL